MSDHDHDVEISVSSSSNEKPQKKSSSDDDKPNIVVNDQKEVHMKVSSSESDHDGSITAQETKPINTDPSKDPEIKPDKKAAKKDNQSQCCLLI